jgi:hypothetical protein
MNDGRYTEIENAIVDAIYSHFDDDFVDDKDQVVAGSIDVLLKQLLGESKKYGCLVEFGGGGRTRVEPFKHPIWQWSIICVFMIRYTGDVQDVEGKLRSVINRLSTLFKQDHTVGGITPRARIERIDQAEVTQMNDVPMYWVPFEISVLEGPDY